MYLRSDGVSPAVCTCPSYHTLQYAAPTELTVFWAPIAIKILLLRSTTPGNKKAGVSAGPFSNLLARR